MGEIIILLGLILINSLFAMSEMAIASARRARLQNLADQGNPNAKIAIELAESPTQFLSTVQTFITLLTLIQGIFGGEALAGQLSEYIRVNIPTLSEVSNTVGYIVVVGLTTYCSLVLGELVPKRLGIQYAERIALLVARPMSILAKLGAPVVWILSRSTNLIIRLLGVRADQEETVTQLEILAMVEEGVNTGVFEEKEQEMVEAVFRLDDQRIGSLVTPRTEMIWLDLNDTPEAISQKITKANYSAYPVARDNIDNVLGIVQAKDLLAQLINQHPLNIENALMPPVFIPESVSVAAAIQRFKKEGIQTAFIVSEYGGIEGIVRMHDIIEQIFGDIHNNSELSMELDAVQREDGSWLIDGQYTIVRFEEHFPNFEIPADEHGKYETVAGFTMARLGRVPDVADRFEYQNLRFEVVDMDGVRIDKILVQSTTHSTKDNTHE